MTKPKHSPLPWSLDFEDRCIHGSDKEFVTHISESRFYDGRKDDTAKVNAEFIVKAVNSHYDLLEACKYVVENTHCSDLGYNGDVLRKAIAKAEGGENYE